MVYKEVHKTEEVQPALEEWGMVLLDYNQRDPGRKMRRLVYVSEKHYQSAELLASKPKWQKIQSIYCPNAIALAIEETLPNIRKTLSELRLKAAA